MSLKSNQKGFTIVELLIVVVVIAILAAISIVAYTGITNRANRSAAMEAANAVKSVATTFQGTNGALPALKSEFVAGHNGNVENAIAKLPGDITFKTGAVVATDDPKTVQVIPYPTDTAPYAGFRIYYWDYVAKSVDSMDVGVTTSTTATAGLPDNT